MYVLMHWKIATIIPIRLGEICMTWEYDPAADNKRFRSFFNQSNLWYNFSKMFHNELAMYFLIAQTLKLLQISIFSHKIHYVTSNITQCFANQKGRRKCYLNCSSQPSIVHWLSSPIFPCCSVGCPTMVTSHQISLLLAPHPQTHTFSESLW